MEFISRICKFNTDIYLKCSKKIKLHVKFSVAFGNNLSDKICNEYVNFDVVKPLNEPMEKKKTFYRFTLPSFNEEFSVVVL